MKVGLLTKGDIVQIQRGNSEWTGLHGIVDKVEGGIAYIWCVQKPCYHYEVRDDNIRDIKLIDFCDSKRIKLLDIPHYYVNNVSEIEVGSIVIIEAENEWHNEVGIVQSIINNVAYIHCTMKGSLHAYAVKQDNIRDITILVA